MTAFTAQTLQALARAHHWTVRRTAQGHLMLIPPDPTRPIVHVGSKLGDRRTLRNAIAELRRSGLPVPH